MRLFNLGFPKSGTTTLNLALAKAGLKTVHWELPGFGHVGPRIYRRYYEGQDPLLDFCDFDAITQADFVGSRSFWPQMDFALTCQIIRFHPECRLLLLRRDPAKIADSISRWVDMQQRLSAVGAPGLPMGYADNQNNIIRWIEGHFFYCRTAFGRDKRFIEVDIEAADARAKIEDAAQVDLPWWGRANENPRKPTAAATEKKT